jgi:PadR family transcriptional regulator AphA
VVWGLPEWTVLAVLREGPLHGFAVAALTAADGELGRIWQIPRPVVYRALKRLEDGELVSPSAVEAGSGPPRTVFGVTAAGAAAVEGWLGEPVPHVRDVRSHLLVKLALLHRSGRDDAALLAAQRQVLDRILRKLDEAVDDGGFGDVLLDWRRSAAAAALDFVQRRSAR